MRDRLTAFVATPAPAGTMTGNRVTALRWAKRLRELGWRVVIGVEWHGEPCDLLVALHARKCHASIVRHARQQPEKPRVVALTGTDVYGNLDADANARESIALADRLIVLQPLAIEQLAEDARAKARVIRQSAPILDTDAARTGPGLCACVLAHLREVKDPLLAARALALLPTTSSIRIVHLGAADETWRRLAIETERATAGRWTWAGARRRGETLATLASCSLLVLTSRSEGGANVVTEAIAAGVPVLSTRIDGSIGILGDDYPGYFPVGDAPALAALFRHCEDDPAFLADLKARVVALRQLVDPARERAGWRALLEELRIPKAK